jgi:hypothetical protein
MSNEPGVAQPCQHTEMFGDRSGAEGAKVDHVEVVSAQLADVLLNLNAELLGRRPRQPLTRGVTPGSDFGGDDEVNRIRRQSSIDQLVR